MIWKDLFIFITILSLHTKPDVDGMQQVVERVNDPALQKELLKFAEQGIEKKVTVSDNDVWKVIDAALAYQGTPHKMGGCTMKGIDCSGLVKMAFAPTGIDLPHSSCEQARFGRIIPEAEHLQRGDLLFFCKTYKTPKPITHTGIYLGDGTFIHASSSLGVYVTPLDHPYWKEHYLFATRILDDQENLSIDELN